MQPCDFALKVADSLDLLLAYWDKDLICRFANSAYEVWFGRSREQLLGMSMKDVLGDLYNLNLPYIQGALAGQVQVFERDIPMSTGEIRHSLASYYPDIVDGVVQGFSVQVTNVTALKDLQVHLEAARIRAEELATHDFLTGLPNRLTLTDRITTILGGATRAGEFVAVVAIDLDGFKSINDTYGHDVGDDFLKEIARRMQSAIRVTDTLTRLGGDEFILLAPYLSEQDSIHFLLERIFEHVSVPWTIKDCEHIPTLSCGVAIFPTNAHTPDELMKKADAALYVAKRSGKNRFVFSD
ncbi:diguanylate cyclase (GGDEF) domain-containing protein [Terriglobus roseus DSM 18391]|uniref:Diguanylate cyclase (GGDEF) domain-containing protein n=2 Tax=Terriglobus roseus TaxID=392734 RepID=I3ZC50_TERRK|nr:diguanylate cyclase (GGDEF) domain-containing protein [Terriglobus roseus DSM 18391]